jgi:hypothetical protein
MANQEQLDILAKGVEAWNDWRKQHPAVQPDLREGRFIRENLKDIDLSGATLTRADLVHADLAGADLRGALLNYAALNRAVLDRADLERVRLDHADITSADLLYTNLRGANFYGADLSYSDLSNADLSGAGLISTRLMSTSVINTTFTKTTPGQTIFAAVDLGVAHGLQTVRHLAPSAIDIETFYRSKGQIPEVFLRGAGVPEKFITYVKSLVGTAFEFYSAFISYSTKDQEFADRLYADLQAEGVRCWLATEDLKIGDPFRQRIDDSIRGHEKLVLILSEYSVNSPWVQDEVETAIEREHREKRSVLFPIRLDGSVMETNTAWAASIRRTRHIGDFCHWKDHDSYAKVFERLLRDLKAAPDDVRDS